MVDGMFPEHVDWWTLTLYISLYFWSEKSGHILLCSDLASKSKEAAVTMGSKASERAAAVKGKLGDEEYQANLKKNAAETWTKTTSTLSSWWSTAATSVSNVLTEDDGTQRVSLYNRDAMAAEPAESRPKKKMAALSSDQYFGQNTANTAGSGKEEMDVLGMNGAKKKGIDEIEAPFPSKKPQRKQSVESVTDDFDEWGFGGDGGGDAAVEAVEERKDSLSAKGKDHGNGMKKEPDSLLDFGANDTANTMSSVNAVKEDKDGNSSDDLDAFFNEMTNEELGDTEKAKSGNIEAVASKQVGDLLTNDQNKKSNAKGDDDEDWGWD